MATILLVEDDGVIVVAVTMLLEGEGYVVIPKQRGVDAVAHDGEADLALLDLTLPDIGGEEVCRQLKSRGMPVILMSGKEDLKTIAAKTGADDYIEKPFDIDALIMKVREHLVRAGRVR